MTNATPAASHITAAFQVTREMGVITRHLNDELHGKRRRTAILHWERHLAQARERRAALVAEALQAGADVDELAQALRTAEARYGMA